jgi:hypothetical protein
VVFTAGLDLHALDAPPQSVIFVLPTLNLPAALWSFDQAHTTFDANQLIINLL